jgi:hypothetical protein
MMTSEYVFSGHYIADLALQMAADNAGHGSGFAYGEVDAIVTSADPVSRIISAFAGIAPERYQGPGLTQQSFTRRSAVGSARRCHTIWFKRAVTFCAHGIGSDMVCYTCAGIK